MKSNLRPIPGYEGYYISQDGEVYSSKRSKQIRSDRILGSFPYYVTTLSINGKPYNLPTHKLVALAWCDLPEGYDISDVGNYSKRTLLVDHVDGNKLNNNAYNLRWCTALENSNFKNFKGRAGGPKGNKHAVGRKVPKSYNRYIYIYNNNEYKISELCKVLNCSKSCITESFRRNLGLVASGKLTRRIKYNTKLTNEKN